MFAQLVKLIIPLQMRVNALLSTLFGTPKIRHVSFLPVPMDTFTICSWWNVQQFMDFVLLINSMTSQHKSVSLDARRDINIIQIMIVASASHSNHTSTQPLENVRYLSAPQVLSGILIFFTAHLLLATVSPGSSITLLMELVWVCVQWTRHTTPQTIVAAVSHQSQYSTEQQENVKYQCVYLVKYGVQLCSDADVKVARCLTQLIQFASQSVHLEVH